MTNELRNQLVQAGFSEKEIASYLHTLEYRKLYNSRPEVIARRKEYTSKRNERMKVLRSLLKEN